MWSISLVAIYRVDRPEKCAIVIDRLKGKRAYRLLFILNRDNQLVELKASIQMKTHEDINQQQKEISFSNQNPRQFKEGGRISMSWR